MIHLFPNLVAVSLPSRIRRFTVSGMNVQNLGCLDDVDVVLKHWSNLL